jgi:hypothetical protein
MALPIDSRWRFRRKFTHRMVTQRYFCELGSYAAASQCSAHGRPPVKL